jgi:hypothetical protein
LTYEEDVKALQEELAQLLMEASGIDGLII